MTGVSFSPDAACGLVLASKQWGKTMGETHERVGRCHDYLGRMHVAQGEHAKAEEEFRKALAIFEKGLGPLHPRREKTLEALAGCLEDMGKPEAAQEMRRRAEEIRSLRSAPDRTGGER